MYMSRAFADVASTPIGSLLCHSVSRCHLRCWPACVRCQWPHLLAGRCWTDFSISQAAVRSLHTTLVVSRGAVGIVLRLHMPASGFEQVSVFGVSAQLLGRRQQDLEVDGAV
jgi:hypothetical protein